MLLEEGIQRMPMIFWYTVDLFLCIIPSVITQFERRFSVYVGSMSGWINSLGLYWELECNFVVYRTLVLGQSYRGTYGLTSADVCRTPGCEILIKLPCGEM